MGRPHQGGNIWSENEPAPREQGRWFQAEGNVSVGLGKGLSCSGIRKRPAWPERRGRGAGAGGGHPSRGKALTESHGKPLRSLKQKRDTI